MGAWGADPPLQLAQYPGGPEKIQQTVILALLF